MATITFKDFTLSQTLITGCKNSTVIVDGTRYRYKIAPTTKRSTEEVEGFSVDIIAKKGKLQTVKLPLSAKTVVDKISEALHAEKLVKVNFGTPSTLRGKCYAMLSNGRLLQGVSCTADAINIVSIESFNDDFDDMDEIEDLD